ncbi:MAG: hypothetical protein JWM80_2146 [Cyanobacteria bacterium RYN_339]|nr:hypothetical protein [Cyanobacteria bacterium RYN_339]
MSIGYPEDAGQGIEGDPGGDEFMGELGEREGGDSGFEGETGERIHEGVQNESRETEADAPID